MKTVLHKAHTRGGADHGWLKTAHTFSFANYHDSERIHFGALRVLNDDIVAPGMGFGAHPHRDMEIISIPLSGELHHRDSIGNLGKIRKGEIQVMSAGTGLTHSEFNGLETEPAKFLQIWVIPRETGLKPRYEDLNISEKAVKNDFQQIVSPNQDDEGGWISQDAWFNWANFDKGFSKEYKMHKNGNGVYIFVISGKAKIGDTELGERDGMGIWETETFTLEALENSEILLMEVPMQLPGM